VSCNHKLQDAKCCYHYKITENNKCQRYNSHAICCISVEYASYCLDNDVCLYISWTCVGPNYCCELHCLYLIDILGVASVYVCTFVNTLSIGSRYSKHSIGSRYSTYSRLALAIVHIRIFVQLY